MTADRPLSAGTILSYCVYAVPLIATTAAISNFIPPLYGTTFGLSLPAVALALLAIRLIDALVDPVIGLAVDRAKFRHKHRPWLLIALPLYVAATVALFFANPAHVSLTYLVVAGSGVYIAYTVAMVVHQAWAASLADDPRAVSRLFGFREVAVILGILGVFGFAAVASQIYAGDIQSQAAAAGWFIVGAIVLGTFVTYLFTPDPPGAGEMKHGGSLAELWPLLSSRNFVLLLGASLLFNGGWTAIATIGYFSAKHLYGAQDLFALGLTVSFLVAPLGMALWMRAAARFGDQRTLVIACAYLTAVMVLIPLFASFGRTGLMTFYIAMGAGFGAGPYLIRSITGIVANQFVETTGMEVRGTAFAATTFFDKLGSGIGASALVALGWLGFDPDQQITAAGRHALLVVTTAAPTLAFLLTTLLVRAMRLRGGDTA